MVHWTEMRKELRAAIGKFAGLQPDVMQGIDKMQNAAVVTGHPTPKHMSSSRWQWRSRPVVMDVCPSMLKLLQNRGRRAKKSPRL